MLYSVSAVSGARVYIIVVYDKNAQREVLYSKCSFPWQQVYLALCTNTWQESIS